MLMQHDPFRDLDRLTRQVFGTVARPTSMPLDAWRENDEFVVELDLPGIDERGRDGSRRARCDARDQRLGVPVAPVVGRTLQGVEVVEQITALGGSVVGLAADVTVEADLEKLRDAALDRFARIDVVMNNVGVLAIGAPETLPDEAWLRTIDVNLFSIARSNRVFLPGLIAAGSGHVINTASASGLLGYGFDRLPYVASKHAIVGLSEALATYLGPKGVGVTCLCPSGVITNILEGITVYGAAAATPRAPEYRIVTAEDVAEFGQRPMGR